MRVLARVLILLATLAAPTHGIAQEPDSAIQLPRIGHARISAVYDLVAPPLYVYALERENVYVLDIRDPRAVREVANLEFTSPRLWGFVYGSGLYLGGFGWCGQNVPELPADFLGCLWISGMLKMACQLPDEETMLRVITTRPSYGMG